MEEIARDTCPINEAIEDNITEKLYNFFSHNELTLNGTRLLEDSEEQAQLGIAARKFAKDNYDMKTICLPRKLRRVEELNN